MKKSLLQKNYLSFYFFLVSPALLEGPYFLIYSSYFFI